MRWKILFATAIFTGCFYHGDIYLNCTANSEYAVYSFHGDTYNSLVRKCSLEFKTNFTAKFIFCKISFLKNTKFFKTGDYSKITVKIFCLLGTTRKKRKKVMWNDWHLHRKKVFKKFRWYHRDITPFITLFLTVIKWDVRHGWILKGHGYIMVIFL